MKKSTWLCLSLVAVALGLWASRLGDREGSSPLSPGPKHPSVGPGAMQKSVPTPLVSVAAVTAQGGLRSAPAKASEPATLTPDASVSEFNGWLVRFQAAGGSPSAELVEEGRQIAMVRRQYMAETIRQNPERAIDMAVPFSIRQTLPTQVTSYLEEVVSGRGDYVVYCAYAAGTGPHEAVEGGAGQPPYREVFLNGNQYKAFVYGRRLRQMAQISVPLWGVAVDGALALAEAPGRLLETSEWNALSAKGVELQNAACPVCGASVAAASAVVVETATSHVGTCTGAHAAQYARAVAEAEDIPAAPSNGFGYAGTNPAPANVFGTYGTKRALYLRVVFPDNKEVQISEAEAAAVMDKVNEYYVEASFGKTAVSSVISPVLTLPFERRYYATAGPGALATDARAAALAAGYDSSAFDFTIIRHPNVPTFTWGGLGGGGTAWLQASDLGVTIHELGHNYGLPHANFWDTRRPQLPTPTTLPFDSDSLVGHDSVIGQGLDIEYGDSYDVMGSGGGESGSLGTNAVSTFVGHFTPIGKYMLGWLPRASVTSVLTNGVYRVYAADVPVLRPGASYSLTAKKDSARDYWLSARSKINNNFFAANGIFLHWAGWQQSAGYCDLLDTTPGSALGKADAPLLIGRTFSDVEADVHITPISKGGTASEPWFDVAVNHGPFPSNVPPTLNLNFSATKVALGVPITIVATVADANGDSMALSWDFGDGSFGLNTNVVSKSYTNQGDYVIRCEVTDMKGGVAAKHVVVTVGNPLTYRISGRVVDAAAQPVRNARISNGALDNYDFATNYQWAYTDSDGRFTFVNLDATSYDVSAYMRGYDTKPRNFAAPVTLSNGDAVGLEFLARPLPWVTVKAVTDAAVQGATPGTFTMSRTTEDTNSELQVVFLMGGTALPGTNYIAYTNQISQTNITVTPFGPRTQVFKFYSLTFPTGIITTNITITPVTPVPQGPDQTVSLTVMDSISHVFLSLTNGDDGIAITNTNSVVYTSWETRAVRGQDTWFQNDPLYVPRSVSDATLKIKNVSVAKSIVSVSPLNGGFMSENAGDNCSVLVSRFGRLDIPVTVRLGYSGTATYGVDYANAATEVVLPIGVTSTVIPINVIPDTFLEGNEQIIVSVLRDGSYDIGSATANLIIGDNDLPLVTMTATDPIAQESGLKPALITVSRYGDLTLPLTVQYLATGTAVASRDYRPLSGRITIPAGQPNITFTVIPRDNRVKDGGLTVSLFVADSPLYNIGTPNTANVFIQDAALPTVQVFATDAAASEPTDTAEFTFTRTGDLTQPLEVSIRMDGSAVENADYRPIGNRVVFAAGQSTLPITVSPMDDPFREDDETITVNLVPGTTYNVGSSFQATATLSDNDGSALPAIGFLGAESSGLEGGKVALIPVRISYQPGADPSTVDYRIIGGSAVKDVDYTGLTSTGRVVFTQGKSKDDPDTNRLQFIAINLIDNTNAQANRTFTVQLVEPFPSLTNVIATNEVSITNDTGDVTTTNVVVTNLVVITTPMNAFFDTFTKHTFTILDDDASTVDLEVTDGLATEQDSKAGLFTIRRSSTNGTQVVNLVVGGTASNGRDYLPIGSQVTIPAGFSSVQVPVIPTDDVEQEYIETVKLTIISAPGAKLGTNLTGEVKILDNDGTVEFSQPTFQVAEGAGVAAIGVRRTGDASQTVSVDYLVSGLTATAGVDFVATNSTLTFAPGETLKTIEVPIIDDTIVESSETFSVTLLSAAGGVPIGGQSTAVVTILDDDSAVQFSQALFKANENTNLAIVTIQRVGALSNVFSVDMVATNGMVTNGVAEAFVDYVATNRTITFAAGQASTNVFIKLRDDVLAEGDEAVQLYLTNVVGQATASGITNATLLIVDDECVLDFTTNAVSVAEFGRSVKLTVRRVGGTVNAVSADFSTKDITAKAGSDYVAASGTVSLTGDHWELPPDGSSVPVFVPGQTNKVVEILIYDDNLGEGDETFSAKLANPKGPAGALAGMVVLGANTNATVTILDDEKPGSTDFLFDPGYGPDGSVTSLSLQSDGKVVVGGNFQYFDTVFAPGVVLLYEYGYLDSSFTTGEGPDGSVLAVAVQGDQRATVAGDFVQYDGSTAKRVMRLNADGTLFNQFNASLGANAVVNALAAQSDGKILIGGAFTSVGGGNRNRIARLAADGSLDATFNPGAGITGGDVLALALDKDGGVIVGGSFTTASGESRAYLARYNATGGLDKTFALNATPNGAVRAIAVMTDGRIAIGGDFLGIGSASRKRVAILLADGSVDPSFDPGTGADKSVYAIGVEPDGRLVVGGAFTSYAGTAVGHYARLDQTGVLDSTFTLGSGADGAVRAIAVQPDSAFIIGGDFTTVNDLPRSGVARIHGDEKLLINRIQFGARTYQASETGTNVVLTVVRSGDLAGTVKVDFATADITATAGADYTETKGTLTFTANQTQKTITVPILDDTAFEGTETFAVTLTNLPSGYTTNAQLSAVVSILDDEGTISFSSANYVVQESSEIATVILRRLGATNTDVSVTLQSADGTAIAGRDYLPVSTVVTFAPGQTEATVNIQVLDDTEVESAETVQLALSNPSAGVGLGQVSTAVLTINDDDQLVLYRLTVAVGEGGSVNLGSGLYPAGSALLITATPAQGYLFDHWEGFSTSKEPVLELTMNSDVTLTAVFRQVLEGDDFEVPGDVGLGLLDFTSDGWFRQTNVVSTGKYALRAKAILDSQSTYLALTVELRAGTAAFDYRTSSEGGFDFLEFYLDGQRLARWSGQTPWRRYTFDVAKGYHDLKWVYVKDASASEGNDTAYLDNLYLPLASAGSTPEPPRLSLVGADGTGATVRLEGSAGVIYTIQASTDLRTWQDVFSGQTSNGTLSYTDTAVSGKQAKFYRAVVK